MNSPTLDFNSAEAAAARERLNAGLNLTTLSALHETPDPLVRHFLDLGLRATSANEGTLWLVNDEETRLIPVLNTGPNAAEILARHQQPLDEGLIGMVFVNGQSLLENDVHLNENQSKRLDRMLGLRTRSLIAAPYHLFDRRVGVFSFVQLEDPKQEGGEFGLNPGHLEEAENLASLIARLMERALLRRALGWEPV
ncbi:MAG: hypothetical protein ACI8UO_006036 [Verrucomicrobiales bacterium]|jgi:hypothetical protein